MISTKVVALAEMARQMQVDRSNARRWLLRAAADSEIETLIARDPAHRQRVLAWSEKDATALLGLRVAECFPLLSPAQPETISVPCCWTRETA